MQCKIRNAARMLLALTLLGLLASASVHAQDKVKVAKLDDLPRHGYRVTGKAIDLLKSDAAFASFAAKVRKDIESDLATYEIEDKATLKNMLTPLMLLDLLDGKDDQALEVLKRARALEDKPGERLTRGLMTEAIVAARRQAAGDGSPSAIGPAYDRSLAAELAPLPYDVVQDQIRQSALQAQILNENVLIGMVESIVDPVIAKSGELSSSMAWQLVGIRFQLVFGLSLKDRSASAFQAYLDQHRETKTDIWTARAVALPADGKLTPVRVGVWDAGVDTELFKGQFVGGIAFDLDCHPAAELLQPIGEAKSRLTELFGYLKGASDAEAGIDTSAARAFKTKVSAMKPAEVGPFIEAIQLCSLYSHGTHVAGLAMEGDPWARLVVARFSEDYHLVPKAYTPERAAAMAREWQETVKYFREQHVRVVNMSWGYDIKEFEGNLEANGIGKDAADRAARARQILDILKPALFDAMRSAPDILFVAAAGNADNDVAFDGLMPASFELPNLLVVGAVDQAGDPTGFTSYGKTVRVYANGYEVESYVPGGQRLKFSGTSMASPNVANLACKILAMKPDLKPAEVISLIAKGVVPVLGAKRPMPLIDPKRTLGLIGR
jgi:hypothetical protein